MKQLLGATAFVVLLSAALFCLADPGEEPTYVSDKPLYTKVALNAEGSKVLTLVFDESKGTSKGYDVLYADVALSGSLDKARKVEATSYICTAGVHFYFPPIELNLPYNKKAAGISDPCQVNLSYERHTASTGTTARLLRSSAAARMTTENFAVTTCVKLRDGSTERQYSFSQSIRPSPNRNVAPVWSFPRDPQVAIITKPDEQKKGNLGIGLDLAQAGSQEQSGGGTVSQGGGCGCSSIQMHFQCKPAMDAHVEIKTPDGKVVHRGDAPLDEFTFG